MSGDTRPELNNADLWKHRLTRAIEEATERPLIFVLGDGIARDRAGGVWSVSDILTRLKAELSLKPNDVDEPVGDTYGRAIAKLKAKGGGRAVANLFRQAVLAANIGADESLRNSAAKGNPEACNRVQKLKDDWHIPAGVQAVAEIANSILSRRKQLQTPAPAPLIITTNFDPLLEIALERAGIKPDVCNLLNDDRPSGTDSDVGIWHVHGIWSNVTMHTPRELRAVRPRVKNALSRRLRGADICVLGYGGWEDIVFNTLGELLREGCFGPNEAPEVMWAFFSQQEKDIFKSYNHVFELFSGPLASCQVAYYKGIDAHTDLPNVSRNFESSRDSSSDDDVAGPESSNSNSSTSNIDRPTFEDLLRMCGETSLADIQGTIRGKYNRSLYVSRRREEQWLRDQLRDDPGLRRIIDSVRRTTEQYCQEALRGFMSALQTSGRRVRLAPESLRLALTKITDDPLDGSGSSARRWVTKEQTDSWQREIISLVNEIEKSRDITDMTSNEVLQDIEAIHARAVPICDGMVDVLKGVVGENQTKSNRAVRRRREELRDQLVAVSHDLTSIAFNARGHTTRYVQLKDAWDEAHIQLRALHNFTSPSAPEYRPLFRQLAERLVATSKMLDALPAASLQDAADHFRKAASSVALIVDKAGGGKTNLLCWFVERLIAQRRPVLFVSGKTPIRDESDLIWKVILQRTGFVRGSKEEHLVHLDALLAEANTPLYVVVDGINEADRADVMNSALAYTLRELSAHRFFFFISCRDIYWSFFSRESWPSAFAEARLEGGLFEFSQEEVDEAIPKYTTHFKIEVSISDNAKQQLRHPLLLRFFCEAYGDATGPMRKLAPVSEIRLKPIFDQYWKEKISRETEQLVHELADSMFLRSTPSLDLGHVSTKFVTSDTLSPRSTYNRLRDEHVIVREEQRANDDGTKGAVVVSFVYEPFMEYAIARSLYYDLRRRMNDDGQAKHLAEVFETLNLRAATFLNAIAIGELLGAFLLEFGDDHELSSEYIINLSLAKGRWLEAKTVANVLERNDRSSAMMLSAALASILMKTEGAAAALLESSERGGSDVFLEVCAAMGFYFLVPKIVGIHALLDALARLERATADELSSVEDVIRGEFDREFIRAQSQNVVALADPDGAELSENNRAVLTVLSELAKWVTRARLLDQPAAADRWKRLPWKHHGGLKLWELKNGDARAAFLRELVDAVSSYGLRRQSFLLAYAANALLDRRVPVRRSISARVGKLGPIGRLFPQARSPSRSATLP